VKEALWNILKLPETTWVPVKVFETVVAKTAEAVLFSVIAFVARDAVIALTLCIE
jgi:hypothetical protein